MFSQELVETVLGALAEASLDVIRVSFSERRQIRVVLDKDPPGPVTVSDLSRASRIVAECLHNYGYDPRAFNIQCESPGADRLLTRPKDFERFRGSVVRISLRQKVDGRKNFKGQLLGLHDEQVVVRLEDGSGDHAFRINAIAEARLVPVLHPSGRHPGVHPGVF